MVLCSRCARTARETPSGSPPWSLDPVSTPNGSTFQRRTRLHGFAATRRTPTGSKTPTRSGSLSTLYRQAIPSGGSATSDTPVPVARMTQTAIIGWTRRTIVHSFSILTRRILTTTESGMRVPSVLAILRTISTWTGYVGPARQSRTAFAPRSARPLSSTTVRSWRTTRPTAISMQRTRVVLPSGETPAIQYRARRAAPPRQSAQPVPASRPSAFFARDANYRIRFRLKRSVAMCRRHLSNRAAPPSSHPHRLRRMQFDPYRLIRDSANPI